MGKRPYKYLFLRDQRWHYQRNVPKRFKHVEIRKRIRIALHTTSLQEALQRRDALTAAEDAYWTALSIEAAAQGGVTDATRTVQMHHYQAAIARAMSFGYAYKTAQQLLTETPVDEILDRTDTLAKTYSHGSKPPQADTTALLGGVTKPEITDLKLSEVFKLYLDEIAFDKKRKKSPSQAKSWEKAKRASINYFIEVMGDLQIGDIERDHAVDFKKWWANRILVGDENGKRPTPYTANRHIGNVNKLYKDYFSYRGEEGRPSPFRNLRFEENRSTKKVRPPFETAWLRDKFLVPGLFNNVNSEARHILYALIETGARPSEICNLKPKNIRLNGPIPYIAIREEQGREIKADASDRDIPLVGISLKAMQAYPDGFPRYVDKETSLSAILMKTLKSHNLLPTSEHKVYSIRHSFEKRMLEADLDYGLRCNLMGHKNERPEYGDGGSLEFRRDKLLKVVFPYDGWSL